MSVEIVRVKESEAIAVTDARVEALLRQHTPGVVDGVGGVDEITIVEA